MTGSQQQQHDYYHPSELYSEGRVVYVRVGGEDVYGFCKFTAAGKQKWRVGTLREAREVPANRIEAWRPVDLSKWRDPLPDPMAMQKNVEWASSPEPPSEPESSIGDDWWVNPRVRLGGAGEPPVTALECEIRILRRICTLEMLMHEHKRIGACWPKDLLISSRVVQKNLRSSRTGRLPGLRQEDYQDFHVDASELEARIARWDATNRDVSDVESWPSGLGPYHWAHPDDAFLFQLRAERYSTGAVARAMRIPEKEIVQAYADARQEAFRRSRSES
jgi:hypothetical protein